LAPGVYGGQRERVTRLNFEEEARLMWAVAQNSVNPDGVGATRSERDGAQAFAVDGANPMIDGAKSKYNQSRIGYAHPRPNHRGKPYRAARFLKGRRLVVADYPRSLPKTCKPTNRSLGKSQSERCGLNLLQGKGLVPKDELSPVQ
jgi:hypothetical protein